DGGPPDAGAESLGSAAEIPVMAPLEKPDDGSDTYGDRQQGQHGLEKTIGKERTRDRRPSAFTDGNGDAEAGGVEGLRELHDPCARRRHRQRGDRRIEPAFGYPGHQGLDGGLYGKAIAQVQLLSEFPPKIDADAIEGTVRPYHHE